MSTRLKQPFGWLGLRPRSIVGRITKPKIKSIIPFFFVASISAPSLAVDYQWEIMEGVFEQCFTAIINQYIPNSDGETKIKAINYMVVKNKRKIETMFPHIMYEVQGLGTLARRRVYIRYRDECMYMRWDEPEFDVK